MEYTELKNKSVQELQTLLAEERQKLNDLSFKASEGQLKEVRKVREAKQTIARILTAMNALRHAETKE